MSNGSSRHDDAAQTIYIYNFEIQWDIYIIFLCLCGFVVSPERQERMLNGKDNVVLGFIFDYLTSLGS
jgi:hypothetical protein